MPADQPTPYASPIGKEHHAFPFLTPEQVERTKRFGKVERLRKGTIVFERGEKTVDFFVIIEGGIEIYDIDSQGQPNVFTVHRQNQFTGELDLFSDRKILVSGRLEKDGEVIRINRKNFRELLAAEPDIGDIVMRAFILRRLGFLERTLGGALLIGHRNSAETQRIQRFLGRNAYPFKTLYVGENDELPQLLEVYGVGDADLPVLICSDAGVVKCPSNLTVAETIGIIEYPDAQTVYDVAIVGAGPSGLAAAVYAASEGLHTVVLEGLAPGGQAGTSSKIENYLGFPTGVSGQELAGRAQVQAQKFGAVLALPMQVLGIEGDCSPYTLKIQDNAPVRARTVIIATGAKYRTLALANYESFEGRGIYYAATAIEANLCKHEEVVVVGAGNSAGQAAVYLAGHTKHVHMVVRGQGLASSMSSYLVRRIEASDAITVHWGSEIIALEGDGSLQSISWRNKQSAEISTQSICHLFLMLGAQPNTQWLDQRVATDASGFVYTGDDVVREQRWPIENRKPESLETSLPSVFAIGDVRSGSIKRVASAVGEGSVCVQYLHRVLNA